MDIFSEIVKFSNDRDFLKKIYIWKELKEDLRNRKIILQGMRTQLTLNKDGYHAGENIQSNIQICMQDIETIRKKISKIEKELDIVY